MAIFESLGYRKSDFPTSVIAHKGRLVSIKVALLMEPDLEESKQIKSKQDEIEQPCGVLQEMISTRKQHERDLFPKLEASKSDSEKSFHRCNEEEILS